MTSTSGQHGHRQMTQNQLLHWSIWCDDSTILVQNLRTPHCIYISFHIIIEASWRSLISSGFHSCLPPTTRVQHDNETKGGYNSTSHNAPDIVGTGSNMQLNENVYVLIYDLAERVLLKNQHADPGVYEGDVSVSWQSSIFHLYIKHFSSISPTDRRTSYFKPYLAELITSYCVQRSVTFTASVKEKMKQGKWNNFW